MVRLAESNFWLPLISTTAMDVPSLHYHWHWSHSDDQHWQLDVAFWPTGVVDGQKSANLSMIAQLSLAMSLPALNPTYAVTVAM